MTTAPNERVVFRDYPVGVWFTGLIAFAVAIVSYHRGRINKKLRELGYEPPLTEYFIWVWRGRPKTEWPFNV